MPDDTRASVRELVKQLAAEYVEGRRRALSPRFKHTMGGSVFSDYYERWAEEMVGAYLAGALQRDQAAPAAVTEAEERTACREWVASWIDDGMPAPSAASSFRAGWKAALSVRQGE
jgi:hypothetical protein